MFREAGFSIWYCIKKYWLDENTVDLDQTATGGASDQGLH